MIDQENVLTGLECLITDEVPCQECSYNKKQSSCIKSIAKDAKELLKDQESVIETLKSDLDETLAVLSEQPDIVRCKDCKFLFYHPDSIMFCNRIHRFVSADWFCADAERKDNGDD